MSTKVVLMILCLLLIPIAIVESRDSQAPEEYGYYSQEKAIIEEEEVVKSPLEGLIFDSKKIEVLVNDNYLLEEDYEPEDMVPLNVPTYFDDPEVNQLREEAAHQLEEMFQAASEDGLTLVLRSGYRSYNVQSFLYDRHVSDFGLEHANKYSAIPGSSEHQAGLAVDVTCESILYELIEEFAETEEGIWIGENSYKYGFIIRYPEGKESITGYMYEPWHLRYLGIDLATDVFESGLTYEEYLLEQGIHINMIDY